MDSLKYEVTNLGAHKITSEYTIHRADSLIAKYQSKEKDFLQKIANKDLQIANNDKEIINLNSQNKLQKKKSRKKILYFCGGGFGVGILAGVLIAK